MRRRFRVVVFGVRSKTAKVDVVIQEELHASGFLLEVGFADDETLAPHRTVSKRARLYRLIQWCKSSVKAMLNANLVLKYGGARQQRITPCSPVQSRLWRE